MFDKWKHKADKNSGKTAQKEIEKQYRNNIENKNCTAQRADESYGKVQNKRLKSEKKDICNNNAQMRFVHIDNTFFCDGNCLTIPVHFLTGFKGEENQKNLQIRKYK